jgi:toxin-antitoxin system PIN domain toxin
LPDLNVWLALSWANHLHSGTAWEWFSDRNTNDTFLFARLSQLGLMRLLATAAVMGEDVLTIGEAWKVYDRWLDDPRVAFRHEPGALDGTLRAATRSISRLASPKALGDRYLLAVSQSLDATLVTFDQGLASVCERARHPVALLG